MTLTNHRSGTFCPTDLKTSINTAFRILALHNSPYRCSVLLPPLCYFQILCHFYSEPSLLAVWIGNVCEANCPEWKPSKSITTFMKECVQSATLQYSYKISCILVILAFYAAQRASHLPPPMNNKHRGKSEQYFVFKVL